MGKKIINQKKKHQNKRKMKKKIMAAGMFILLVILMVCVFMTCASGKDKKQEAQKAVKTEMKTDVSQAVDEQAKKAEELQKVRKQAEQAGYPESIIKLLDKNEETITFVKDYEKKKDIPPADKIADSIEQGTIPHLLQWDERWGYQPYGGGTIATDGCGPTCMAMVVAGLTGDVSVTPYVMARFGEENGYVDKENGTYWEYMMQASKPWGVNVIDSPPDETLIQQELAQGHPIICNVMPGDFTQVGHYIVLTGYKDGIVTVNDPFSIKNTEKTWVYKDIEDQIRGIWIYSL